MSSYGPRQLDAGCIERLGNKGYVISFRCDHVEVELAEDVTVSLERVEAEIVVCTLPNATATALKHQVTRIPHKRQVLESLDVLKAKHCSEVVHVGVRTRLITRRVRRVGVSRLGNQLSSLMQSAASNVCSMSGPFLQRNASVMFQSNKLRTSWKRRKRIDHN